MGSHSKGPVYYRNAKADPLKQINYMNKLKGKKIIAIDYKKLIIKFNINF